VGEGRSARQSWGFTKWPHLSRLSQTSINNVLLKTEISYSVFYLMFEGKFH
jgi:hypothetical protein